ncbi:YggT family protein [Cellvibrio sp.]|uniref:YggT family protein n=1 Tax=Cellvibrio sp. TaxID=1965322 RepID=UPI0039647ED5
MQTLAQIAIYVISTLGTLYVSLVLLRFLAQVVRADYYNPLSKALVKYTNPLLVPLRKIIPGFFGIDWAALVLALILQTILFEVVLVIAGYGIVNIALVILWAAVALLGLLVTFYYWGTIIMIIASWVAPQSYNPALRLLNQIIDPVMAPFRKILPPLGVLDLSPIIFFMVLHIIRGFVLPALAQSVGMIPGLGFGF